MKYLNLNHSAISQAGSITISKYLNEFKIDLISFKATKNRIEIEIDKLADSLVKMKNLKEVILF